MRDKVIAWKGLSFEYGVAQNKARAAPGFQRPFGVASLGAGEHVAVEVKTLPDGQAEADGDGVQRHPCEQPRIEVDSFLIAEARDKLVDKIFDHSAAPPSLGHCRLE